MKRHAIIPIFIPHEGCPNDCVFCNQRKITARAQAPGKSEMISTIKTYLSTLSCPRPDVIEIAMYGGSFTGIPLEAQRDYLSVALEYKKRGLVDKIHLSTRPDYIDPEILAHLRSFQVDVIELGVQSFDDEVLRLSNRGHNSEIVYESSRLILESGFTLGIQLMIGLPGDSREASLKSAREAIKIGPQIARLYPTVILEDTVLSQQYREGTYHPFSQEEMLSITKDMYSLLTEAGIQVIRVGLKSSDLIWDRDHPAGNSYHPAFRQLVEGEIAKEKLEEQLSALITDHRKGDSASIIFFSNPRSFSNMVGNGGRNRTYFQQKYPDLSFFFKTDVTLPDGCYRAELEVSPVRNAHCRRKQKEV